MTNCEDICPTLCPSTHPKHGRCSLHIGYAHQYHVAFVTQCFVEPATWTDEDLAFAKATTNQRVLKLRTTEEARLALRYISGFSNTVQQQDVLSDVLAERDTLREQIAAIRKTIG